MTRPSAPAHGRHHRTPTCGLCGCQRAAHTVPDGVCLRCHPNDPCPGFAVDTEERP